MDRASSGQLQAEAPSIPWDEEEGNPESSPDVDSLSYHGQTTKSTGYSSFSLDTSPYCNTDLTVVEHQTLDPERASKLC